MASQDGARLLWLKTDLLDDSSESGLFRRFTDEELAEFAESLQEVGIVHPPVVRPKGERFEIISGHHRVRAARLLGWEEVLCVVRDLPDDEAVAQLIDANIKGRTPGPMEIAKAVARRMQAIGNRRGERADLQLPDIRRTSAQNEPKLLQGRTLEHVGAEFGMSRAQAQRYLKLNDLIPELQTEVESGRLDATKGYELALLSPETQKALLEWKGAALGEMSVAEVQKLRKQLEEAEKEKARAVEELRRDLSALLRRLEEAERRKPEERVVLKPDPEKEREVSRLRAEVDRLNAEIRRLTSESAVEAAKKELDRLNRELQKKQDELVWLNRVYERRCSAVGLLNLVEKVFGPLEKSREEFFEKLRSAELNALARMRLGHALEVLRQYAGRIEEALQTVVVDAGGGEGNGS